MTSSFLKKIRHLSSYVIVFGLLLVGGFLIYDKFFSPPSGVFSSSPLNTITLEIAKNDEQRERGLMFRKTMPQFHGMAFIFEKMEEHPFWMKNTPLPLDLVFLDDKNVVVGVIQHATPFSTQGITITKPSKVVIELNAGEADKLLVEPGKDIVFKPSRSFESIMSGTD
jgi:uncharacterized membrane protein (UPF0127 family)